MLNLDTGKDLQVRLPVFEGPLDLLLYLIRKDELDIYDIPIEQVTAQYIEYLDLMQMLNLELAGEFLVMAATLLYIKSRMLLPVDQQAIDEEAEEEDDPRWELIRQLVEYKKFKDVAFDLRLREAERERVFPRKPARPDFAPLPAPAAGEAGIFDLITAFKKILDRVQKAENLRDIFEDRFTVADKIGFVREIFMRERRRMFADLFEGTASRTEVVVTFLAILELIRLRFIAARQTRQFGEIEIVRVEAS
jgi:segregation and condensation protein A